MESIRCLEYSTVKVPYEILNKTYRNSQKDIDRDIGQLNNLIQKSSSLFEPSSAENQKEQALQALREISAKLEQLNRTVVESVETQQNNLQQCRERTDHLSQFAAAYESQSNSHKRSKAEVFENENALKEFEGARVNRMLVDHLLRMGHFDAAVSLSKESGVSKLVDIDLFSETQEIERELRNHNTEPCLAWCQSNKSKLRKLNSNLEYNLRLQQFVEFVRIGQHCEAIQHARKYFTQVEESFLTEVQRAMGLLAFPTDSSYPRYQDLLSEIRWEELITKFRLDNYSLLHMSSQSLLITTLQAGLSSLKTHQCYNNDSKNTDCPVCSPPFNELAESLPFAKYTRSRLLCSITNSPMDDENPPMALPNGRVYGEKGLLQSIDENGNFTCPVSRDTFHLSDCKKVFIM